GSAPRSLPRTRSSAPVRISQSPGTPNGVPTSVAAPSVTPPALPPQVTTPQPTDRAFSGSPPANGPLPRSARMRPPIAAFQRGPVRSPTFGARYQNRANASGNSGVPAATITPSWGA